MTKTNLTPGLIFSAFILLFSFTNCNKSEDCKEKPKGDCPCIHLYDPVCGCNDKTYGNACQAECEGITDYTEGECD
ncbi:MAG: protease inhibitor Kazal-type [Bacteroidota bacterium]